MRAQRNREQTLRIEQMLTQQRADQARLDEERREQRMCKERAERARLEKERREQRKREERDRLDKERQKEKRRQQIHAQQLRQRQREREIKAKQKEQKEMARRDAAAREERRERDRKLQLLSDLQRKQHIADEQRKQRRWTERKQQSEKRRRAHLRECDSFRDGDEVALVALQTMSHLNGRKGKIRGDFARTKGEWRVEFATIDGVKRTVPFKTRNLALEKRFTKPRVFKTKVPMLNYRPTRVAFAMTDYSRADHGLRTKSKAQSKELPYPFDEYAQPSTYKPQTPFTRGTHNQDIICSQGIRNREPAEYSTTFTAANNASATSMGAMESDSYYKRLSMYLIVLLAAFAVHSPR